MKELELPEPAAGLWLQTRGVLSSLAPENEDWTLYLGGGTVLAARWKHRLSTDIDVVLRKERDLSFLAKPGGDNLADRLGGEIKAAWEHQIKVRCGAGEIDLNTAPVAPKNGHERVRIAGRAQHVLSTTQILRGKFRRTARGGPVRDAYDVIRCAVHGRDAGHLAAAYGLLDDRLRLLIERSLKSADERYRKEAEKHLMLTEEPVVDWSKIGSTAAETLNGHRLRRVVIELHGDAVSTERTTKNGRVFKERCHPATVRARYSANGIEELLRKNGIESRHVVDRISICRAGNRNGVIFDTADPRPADRIRGRNPSMKRHGAPPRVAVDAEPGAAARGKGPPGG